MKDLFSLPTDLPIPTDDGACDHLFGSKLPSMTLTSTSGEPVNLAELPGTVVLYFYPMTGHPDSPPMIGWNEIPGARGCTPQSCGFRDHYRELMDVCHRIYGISAQPLREQQESRQRLALPFELLNDSDLALTRAMRLPTFTYQGMTLIKRMALIVIDVQIRKVFYPIFPPDRNAEEVLLWLNQNQ